MKKKYLSPQMLVYLIFNEESVATASIVTGGIGSTPIINNEIEQQSDLELWDFNL